VRVDIKLLGSMEASIGGVSFVPTASKQRQLLAILALNAGRTVPVSVLMEEIWGPRPPRSAATTLHTYIGKLRRELELALRGDAQHCAKDILVTDQIGYRLNVPQRDVDTCRYEQLAGLGRSAADESDHLTAARTLQAALDLWRGSALSDIAAGPQLMIDVVRLEESRLADLDLRIEADLCLGRHRKLLGELAALCARYPMSENFYAHYMLALYRSGRQWRALEVFQRLRSTMVNQLGVDPSAKLRQLQQAILCGDPSVDSPTFVIGAAPTAAAFAG
jgi:SARP family transcriptional regulator, regulator of embCAB operon